MVVLHLLIEEPEMPDRSSNSPVLEPPAQALGE
jgi:hypothetical protein